MGKMKMLSGLVIYKEYLNDGSVEYGIFVSVYQHSNSYVNEWFDYSNKYFLDWIYDTREDAEKIIIQEWAYFVRWMNDNGKKKS